MHIVPRKIYLDRVFDNLFDEGVTDTMRCDIYEKDGIYYMEADIPGFNKQDIKLDFANGYLTVTAEKEENEEETEKNYLKKERVYGKVERRFYFGETVDFDNITAEFNGGMLKVALPKIEQKENKTAIEIQ